jgi:hypothetical protein
LEKGQFQKWPHRNKKSRINPFKQKYKNQITVTIMALLKKLFSSKQVANSDVIPADVNVKQDTNSDDNNQVEDTKDDERKNNLIKITWGTGMPIDVIFCFIHKNFEEEGYQDALVNTDLNYRETKVGIIRNDLEMLFKRISLKYKGDIRMLDIKIENARNAYALSSAALLQARRDTYEEHLSEIENMEKLLEAGDSKMMTMIESYRRGFMKGIAAMTLKFINNE